MINYNEAPRWLRDVVDRYQAKPSPEEMRRTIKRAMEELDCTQEELGALFGTNQQAVSRWLNHPQTESV